MNNRERLFAMIAPFVALVLMSALNIFVQAMIN